MSWLHIFIFPAVARDWTYVSPSHFHMCITVVLHQLDLSGLYIEENIVVVLLRNS